MLFDRVCEPENWILAWLKAIRGKSRDPFVLAFRENLDRNLEELRLSFANGSFAFGRYEYFTISDPKERMICAASFPERIAHHALMNVLDPLFEGYQIADSYACRRGKGTEAAVLRAFRAVKSRRCFLKMDVRKYFDSIDHAILAGMLRRRIKDRRMLVVLDAIIDSYEAAPGRGIPIGNLTSQYFANCYLAALDHRAKEAWRVRSWIRYMDDILVVSDGLEELRRLYGLSCEYCRENLSLELKPAILGNSSAGAPFLGFLIKKGGIFLSRKSRRRFETRARMILHFLCCGTMSEREAGSRLTAMCAHTALARARSFRYAVFHGGVRGRGQRGWPEPRESRRELEQ